MDLAGREDQPPEPNGATQPLTWKPAPLDHFGDLIWVVLGGDGLKGLAHVGAWQAIE